MVDYSRFDHLVDSDDEDAEKVSYSVPSQFMGGGLVPSMPSSASTSSSSAIPTASTTAMTSKGKDGRYKFEHEGRLIYEWEQSLTEVIIYIPAPPNVSKKMLNIIISPTHLSIGIKDTPPYLDEDTGGMVIAKESMWMIDDGEIIINLQKMAKGEAWEYALRGAAGKATSVDPFTKEEVKKKMMLERFQEEHPQFDFSGADFNGQVPNAREFMGGIKYF